MPAHTSQQTIVVAGATGDLGTRIVKALVARGASVRALVRPDAVLDSVDRVITAGASVARADARDVGAVAEACRGAACVVSALNGLRDVIVERQGVLLDAAARAGVARFIPSDYSADYTRTQPGDNRNFDFRREFMARADAAPIAVTSVLNGAFMDMLGAEMPIIQPAIRRVLYWSDADQPLDFTTKDDTAAFTAAAALDAATPRFLRTAGDTVSARDIAAAMSEVTGTRFRTLWAGSIGTLGATIRAARLFAPQPGAVFPAWQGMQYSRDMFSGRAKLDPIDRDRYPELRWTAVRGLLASRFPA